MPKKPAIRWRASDEDKLRRLVKNYNAKVSRLQKQNTSAESLPDKVSIKSLRTSIATRADFNKTTKQLSDFTKRSKKPAVKRPPDELQKAVKNWNAKVKRLEKKGINPDFIPNRTTVADQRALIRDDEDRSRVLANLREFTARGAEQQAIDTKRGVKLARWQVNTIERNREAANAEIVERKGKVLNAPVRFAGDEDEGTRLQMYGEGDAASVAHIIGTDISKVSKKELDIVLYNIDRMISPSAADEDLTMRKNNYIKAAAKNNVLAFDPELEKMVRDAPFEVFFDTVSTDEAGTFEYLYYSQDAQRKAENVRAAWEAAYARYRKD